MHNNLLAGPGGSGEITNPVLESLGQKTGLSFFQSFIPNLIGLGFVVGTIIFFFILILGAIQWISSGGDKQALEGARGKVTNAVIGIVILFSVFAVINIVEAFFKIKIMTLDIGPLVIQ
jgi:hypothetical protein